MIRMIKSLVLLTVFGVAAAMPVSAYAQTQLATGKPTVFKLTVTKVEMYNGTSFVTIFTGSSQLDMVAAAGGTAFPGISALSLPAGTYTQIRVTFANSFTLKGSLAASGTTYYTTATTLNSGAGLSASTTAGALAEGTIYNPTWGALNADVVQTISIASVTIAGTAYSPTLKFDVSSSLVLSTLSGVNYFTLAAVTISIV